MTSRSSDNKRKWYHILISAVWILCARSLGPDPRRKLALTTQLLLTLRGCLVSTAMISPGPWSPVSTAARGWDANSRWALFLFPLPFAPRSSSLSSLSSLFPFPLVPLFPLLPSLSSLFPLFPLPYSLSSLFSLPSLPSFLALCPLPSTNAMQFPFDQRPR